MTFKVMDRRCDQCLYGNQKIVSDARRKQLIQDIISRDSHFLCHKGTICEEEICCRGDFDAHGGGQLGRIADRLRVIEFVSTDEYEYQVKSSVTP